MTRFFLTLFLSLIFLNFPLHSQARKVLPGTLVKAPESIRQVSESEYLNELNINFSSGFIQSYKVGDSSLTDLTAIASYQRLIREKIQVGGEGGILSRPETNADGKLESKYHLTLLGTATYNLESDLSNSPFITAGLGLYPSYKKENGKYESKFSYQLDVGKRFLVWEHISYKPLFRLYKHGDEDLAFLLLAFNVSVMF